MLFPENIFRESVDESTVKLSTKMLITSVFLYSQVEGVQWTFDNIDSESGDLHHLAKFLSDKNIDMVINLPMRGSGARR